MPLSSLHCLIGWIVSTALFFIVNIVLGGPTEGDAAESVYSTWAIAHANFACAYPPAAKLSLFPNVARPFAFTAPLYPLITGLFAAVLRIGHSVAFPSRNLGSNCSHAFLTIFHWSASASAIGPTINLSYLVWPVLMVGAITMLRSSGRGRRGWEPVTLIILALTPPVVMCLVDFFHPQDVFAMGLALIGLALFLRQRWIWAGVLLGLAFTAQPFAVLVFAPLLVVAPRRVRANFAASALAAVAVVSVPVIIATSGRAFRATLFGSSRIGLVTRPGFRSFGGTLLWETDLRGLPLLFLSRVLPILLAMALAWWASRRIGPAILTPLPLISLIATALTLRLVFEENLFGYYFMAVAVILVILDCVQGHFRGYVICWIGLVTLAFNPVHWGLYSNWTPWGRQLFEWLPVIFMAIAALSIFVDIRQRHVRFYKMAWVILVALTCNPQWWGPSVGQQVLPSWMWQVILVPIALALGVGPLRVIIKEPSPSDSEVPVAS